MKKLIAIAALSIVGMHLALCVESSPEELFELGNTLYRNGNYDAAAKTYERILSAGYVSPELYFNLGNTYYRLEQLPRAILAYERAARLRPNDPDIAHNLKLSYLKTIDRIEPLPELFLIQWLRAYSSILSSQTAQNVFFLGWAFLFLALTCGYFLRQPEVLRIVRSVVLVSFIVVLFAASLLIINVTLDTSTSDAIIVGNTVTAKSSPDPKSIDAFVIHEGLKVKIHDSVGTWVKISLPDGKVGWIEFSQCEKI